MDIVDISKYAASLGVKVETEQKILAEKRYVVIVEVIHNDKRYYFSSGSVPIAHPLKAKQKVLDQIKFELLEHDMITFRCMETVFAPVPIETVLTSPKYEMQAISSRWLKPEELKEFLLIDHEKTT